MGPSTATAARARAAFLLLVVLLAVPWPGAAAQAGYRVVSVAGAGGQLSARLELAGDGEKAELGPDVQRLSLTARQVRSSPGLIISVLALRQRSLLHFHGMRSMLAE